MKSANSIVCIAAVLAAVAVEAEAAKSFADCRLLVQFDKSDLADAGCAKLLEGARRVGADGVQIERCIFYPDGEKRTKELKTLADEIRFFHDAGYPVAVWTTSLGYGPMDDADFLRRFPKHRPLRSIEGGKAAVCATDTDNREAIADNVRDFLRAGAKTILFDDDLVQACRPGICCVCDEHLRRIAAKMGVESVTPEQVREAYSGRPNKLRTACLDVMGESLMEFCRAMRKAADEVDPDATLATCLSISQFDLDGVDVPEMVRTLAGRNTRPFVRLSGATYWVRHPRNARNFGQGLGGVVEFIRWQAALMRSAGIVALDENDPYPRDIGVVPEGMCEAYDRAMIAEGDVVRNKYVLRRNVKTNKGIDPEYLAAHLAGIDEAKKIEERFRGASPVGFEVFAPQHLLRDATLPEKYIGRRELVKFFSQPMAGILLAANGAPTRYDRDTGAPLAAFGPAAAKLPEAWLSRGVVLDLEGARLMQERGVDVGLGADSAARQVEGWRLYKNGNGQKFAVAEKTWYDLDYSAASPTPVPADEIWKFFTGKDIPFLVSGAHGLHMIAKERSDGTAAVIVNNMTERETGPFTVTIHGKTTVLKLPPWCGKTL